MFDWIIIKLEGTRTAIKSQVRLNSGHIRPLSPDYLPLSTEKNVVDMIAPSVLIGLSSNLHITKTGINSLII